MVPITQAEKQSTSDRRTLNIYQQQNECKRVTDEVICVHIGILFNSFYFFSLSLSHNLTRSLSISHPSLSHSLSHFPSYNLTLILTLSVSQSHTFIPTLSISQSHTLTLSFSYTLTVYIPLSFSPSHTHSIPVTLHSSHSHTPSTSSFLFLSPSHILP